LRQLHYKVVSNPQINPPIIPIIIIGLYAFVINASGKLRKVPTNAPFNQPAIGKSRLIPNTFGK